jgi:hypothetical protein
LNRSQFILYLLNYHDADLLIYKIAVIFLNL